MSTNENSAQKQDLYQRVTSAIVNAIEQGVVAYRMPWVIRQDKGFSPISVSTVLAGISILGGISILSFPVRLRSLAQILFQRWSATTVSEGVRFGKKSEGSEI